MKLLVIGLDCLEPSLLESWKESLPNLSALIEGGWFKKLKSTIPPITIPAWVSMFSGKDPGELGIYGFRNRKPGSYELFIPNATHVREKRLWEIASENNLRCFSIAVPLTYPPVGINGIMISSFLTPEGAEDFTYPKGFAGKLDKLCGGRYIIDVKNFRTEEKDKLLKDIYLMTERRFNLVEALLKEDWDLFIFVEMGPDRMHHGFWRFMDKNHRLYKPGNPYEDAIPNYYAYLDGRIGKILDSIKGEFAAIIVSDHGAKPMKGAISVNDLLEKEGFLKFKRKPNERTRLTPDMVDWSRTRAWAEGGYYARVMLNLKGREPQGIVDKKDYQKLREELKELLSGVVEGTKVFYPEKIYRSINGLPPDLIVHFGDLFWRSAGTVGNSSIYLFENDTGPDDANHSEFGVFLAYPKASFDLPQGDVVDIKEVFRISLDVLGIGDDSLNRESGEVPFSKEEEEEIAKRLSDLGYY